MQPAAAPLALWAWRNPQGLAGVWRGDDATVTPSPDADPEADSVETDRRVAADLVGYPVEATDGHIGKVDEANDETDNAWLVVDTGPWIFGRKVLLPAAVVQHVDHDEQKVYVDRTKDQVKNSPEYDPDTIRTPEYRQRVGDYYTSSYQQDEPQLR
jgi:hypothetical protein